MEAAQQQAGEEWSISRQQEWIAEWLAAHAPPEATATAAAQDLTSTVETQTAVLDDSTESLRENAEAIAYWQAQAEQATEAIDLWNEKIAKGQEEGEWEGANPYTILERAQSELANLGIVPAQFGFEGVVTRPTLFLAGEAGPEPVRIGQSAMSGGGVTITVTGPLVQIMGSADRATAELAARLVEQRMRNVIVEASSSGAPATQKRIRLGTVI
jgi:hypothetical protein